MDKKHAVGQGELTMDWTPIGKLHTVRREESIYTVYESRFGYDPAGQRIKKQIVEETYEDVFPTPPEKESDPFDPPPELVGIDTISTLWYIRDATGNVLAVYEQVGDTMHWREQHLYGSSRLGMVLPAVKRYPGNGLNDTIPYYIQHKEQPYGARRYELTNHLGNVTTVVSDRKVPIDDGGPITYEAAVHSAMDYYPFGSLMPGRGFGAGGEDYRYGFNNMERDDEIKGEGNSYDFRARIYDSRLGRWMSVDPLKEKYPFASPYNFALNTPIQAFDPDGRLVVFVNGFMLDQWATSNSGEYVTFDGAHVTVPHRPYPTFEMSSGNRPTYLGQEFNYWAGVDDAFMDRFEDHNSAYVSGSHNRTSSAMDRYRAGQQSGYELLEKIQKGDVSLADDETIKIVGHSQGAAHAAGMANVLNQAYNDGLIQNPVEQIYYLAPHQPGDFATPEGVFSVQYSRESDWVSSKGIISTGFISGGSTFARIPGVDEMPRMRNMKDEKGGHNVNTFIEIFNFGKTDEGYVRTNYVEQRFNLIYAIVLFLLFFSSSCKKKMEECYYKSLEEIKTSEDYIFLLESGQDSILKWKSIGLAIGTHLKNTSWLLHENVFCNQDFDKCLLLLIIINEDKHSHFDKVKIIGAEEIGGYWNFYYQSYPVVMFNRDHNNGEVYTSNYLSTEVTKELLEDGYVSKWRCKINYDYVESEIWFADWMWQKHQEFLQGK